MSETLTEIMPGTGKPITITDRAAHRVLEILKNEGEGVVLRVSVSGGGCSGFQYGFTLDDTRAADDLVLEKANATVLIDSVSAMYLEGSEIDFVDDLIGSSFKIVNPNATASCGCGTSFAL
ncbi:MAG: iron-sulfur cluster insertion protein ErpA [Parvibaculum sp.]|uniref:iron-sulfur cluster insertion protein ErpA n=1 Tax=Parvibaculum sp. TaxID=2024848 RepID=UPI003C74683F